MCTCRCLSIVAALAVVVVHATASEPKRIRMNYSDTVVFIHKQDASLFVFKGMADPLRFSSKAYLIVHRVQSLNALHLLLKSQDSAGPRPPEKANAEKSRLVMVESAKKDARFDFEAFGEHFSWIPGGAATGWLELPQNLDLKVASVEHLNLHPPISLGDFIDVDTHILNVEQQYSEQKRHGVQSNSPTR